MEFEIIHLPKEKWKGTIIPIKYTTEQYYDVAVNRNKNGYSVEIEKKDFAQPVTHSPEENNFPDKLYEDYREKAFAWGVLVEDELVAVIETDPEPWSNRLRVTELWVAEPYQKMGIGHSLMEIAKEQVRHERRRAIILETQSCNVNAIDFYLHEGFQLIGLDTCCYKNNDLQRKEVRIELGWFPEEKKRLSRGEIEIRMETEDDWYDIERMTRNAFWNKHKPGCDEHYLVHKMLQSKDYLPDLSRIAVKDGAVIGYIMYSKARIIDDAVIHEILTFGPLCVDPKWQGCGIGELLLRETMPIAADKGYKGIVILGDPDYYPRIGFKTCDNFHIATADGRNFDAFMGIELIKEGMKDIKGKFYESEVFETLQAEEVEAFDKQFPRLHRLKFPGQWNN